MKRNIFIVEVISVDSIDFLMASVDFSSITKVYNGPPIDKIQFKEMLKSNSIPDEHWIDIDNFEPEDISDNMFVQYDDGRGHGIVSNKAKSKQNSSKAKQQEVESDDIFVNIETDDV